MFHWVINTLLKEICLSSGHLPAQSYIRNTRGRCEISLNKVNSKNTRTCNEHVIAGWANLKSNVKNQIYASIKFRKLIPNKNVK